MQEKLNEAKSLPMFKRSMSARGEIREPNAPIDQQQAQCTDEVYMKQGISNTDRKQL